MDTVTLRAPEVRTNAVLEFRAAEVSTSGRFLEGIAVPYDTWASIGWFMESHKPGSFARSISEAASQLPLLLWHNNQTFPVGVSHEWRDGQDHLGVVWRLDGSEEANRAADLAEAGMLTGLSIGFAPIRSEWDMVPMEDWDPDLGPEHMDKVTRLESRLLEVSLTPTPAFAGAQVQMVRTREASKTRRGEGRRPRLERARAQLEALRRPA